VTEALDKLRFEIYERVQLPEEIASLQELEELELIPHMQTLPGEDHVQIRGHLLLTGIYRGDGSASPLRQLEHWIPMEISLPMYRVGRLEELTVDVEQFDVDLVSGRTLNVTGTLTLRGVQGGSAPEREWDGDGLRVVHQAPPETWPGLGDAPVQASVYRMGAAEDGEDPVGLKPADEAGAPRQSGDGADGPGEAVSFRPSSDEAEAALAGGEAADGRSDADRAVAAVSGADGSGPAQPAEGASPAAGSVPAAEDAEEAFFGANGSEARAAIGRNREPYAAVNESGATRPDPGEAGMMRSAGADPWTLRSAARESEPASGTLPPQDAAGSSGDVREAGPADERESPVSESPLAPEEPVASSGAGVGPVRAAHPVAEDSGARDAEPAALFDAAFGEPGDAGASESEWPASEPDAPAAEEKPAVKVTLTGKREPAAVGASAEPVGWHSLIGLRPEKPEAAAGPGAGERDAGTAENAEAAGGEGQADLRAAFGPAGDGGEIPASGGDEAPAAKQAEEPAGGDELDWARLFRLRESEAPAFTRVRLCIVQEDESLESVASRYQVQANLLQRFNNLSEPYVTKGQVLYIPS